MTQAFHSTSPSVYLQLMGTAAVHDLCTSVGPELVDPIITLAPRELSTWNPVRAAIENDNYTAGEIWEDPSAIPDEDEPDAFERGIAPLEIRDLACPTFGLGRSTSADGTVITTVGPPWLPLIVPPMSIFSLDPIWAALCTGVLGDSWGQTPFALFDPPIALTPASSLLSTPKVRPTPTPVPVPAHPTTVSERPTPSAESAKPASQPNDPVSAPLRTANPTTSLPPIPVASLQNKGDPSSDPSSDLSTDPKVYPVSTNAGNPLAGSPTPSSSTGDLRSNAPGILPINPKGAVPPHSGEDAGPQTQGIGAIIYNAFGNPGPKVDGSSTVSLSPQSILNIGGQTFTVNPTAFGINTVATASGGIAQKGGSTKIGFDPSGFSAIDSSAFQIAGTIVSEGGPAVTIDGTTVSLGQSGALAVDSSNVYLPKLSDTPNNVYIVAGQIFTPNPSKFTIAGAVISAGGPAAVIDGTTVSLKPSGTLLVGSKTIPLLSSQGSPETVIDGFDVKVQSSSVIVDGTTLSAAVAGVTISGKVFSLEAGGSTLDIGTERFTLPTQGPAAANRSLDVQAFLGGQSKRFGTSLSLTCSVCGFVMLLLLLRR